jgi:Holliday junction resolvasome RuvABC endonuclease subunit
MDSPVVLGIDPASTHIAYVALHGKQFLVRVNKSLGKSGPEACHRASVMTREVISDCLEHFSTKNLIAFYELPVLGRGGFRSTIVQCFTSGAVQGVLYELGIQSYTANVSSWKKAVVGRGNADKGQVAESLRLRWPTLFSATEGNQDAIDASCIALYGRQVLESGVATTRTMPRSDK